MGRPCGCCGECKKVEVLCYVDSGGIVHIEITNAKRVTAYYVNPETAPDITGYPDATRIYLSQLTDMLDDNGNLHYTIPLSTIEYNTGSGIDDFGQGVNLNPAYFLSVSATNSCSTDSCSLSCSGGIQCQIFINERRPIEGGDRCAGDYEISWGTWILSGNADSTYNFNEDVKFFINGQEVAPSYIDSVLANGKIYVDACSLANKYTLSIEADFCSTPATGDCVFEPSCLDKKNSIINEIVGLPDDLIRISESRSYEFDCGPLFREYKSEVKYTGVSAFNGTHIFPKCGHDFYVETPLGSSTPRGIWYFNNDPIGYGQEIWTRITTEYYTDPFTNERVSYTNTYVDIWDVVYYLYPGPLSPDLKVARYAQYASDGERTEWFDPSLGQARPSTSLFYFGYPCDYEQADGTIIPAGSYTIGEAQRGSFPIFDNGSVQFACGQDAVGNSNSGILDPGGGISPHICCTPVCYDGYQRDDPILTWNLLQFNRSYYDECFPQNNTEFGYDSHGSIKAYYACL